MMTLLVLYYRSHFRHLKSFYKGIALVYLKPYFPGLPLVSKLFGDKGYLGKKLVASLLVRALALMTAD
jgi:hypothetical protein